MTSNEIRTEFREFLSNNGLLYSWEHLIYCRYPTITDFFSNTPPRYWIEVALSSSLDRAAYERMRAANEWWLSRVQQLEMLSESKYDFSPRYVDPPPRFSERMGYASGYRTPGYADRIVSSYRHTSHADLTYCPPTPDEPKVEKVSWRTRFGKWVERYFWLRQFNKVKFITLRGMSHCELCDGKDRCETYYCPCNDNEQLKRKK